MILTKIVFLILIIVCIFFYILYLWDFALVLLAVVCILPMFMLVMLLFARSSIKTELLLEENTISKNESFSIQLSLTNKSIFHIGKAEAYLEYYNVFSNRITPIYLDMPIQARNSQRITFRLSSKFCGIVKIRTKFIKIYDPLRIFSFKIGKGCSANVYVLPELHDIEGYINYSGRTSEESDIFSEYKPGDDPSEIFDLREYNPGDKLNRIHWKLSSKKNDLIVKEYSLPIDVPSMLFIDMKCYDDTESTLPVFDTIIESLASLSRFMTENERMHKVVFFSGKKDDFIERTITSFDDLSSLTKELITSVSDNLYCQPYENYFTEDKNFSLSSFTFITSLTDKPVSVMNNDIIDADTKNLITIVSDAETADALTDNYRDVNIFNVTAGRISSCIKDIEL